MSYQFIIGSSGSGKSHYCHKMMLDSCKKNPDKNHILIVPEQFTLWTQKALTAVHPGKSIMDIDILSFERLAYRVFRELGVKSQRILEESGKNLIIRSIMQKNRDSLGVLGKNASKPGYIDEVKSLISELAQYRVYSEDLKALDLSGQTSLLRGKIDDISLIYKAFEEYIDGEYVTAEKILELLISVIDNSNLINDAVIAFDGFTGFGVLQEEIIKKLLVKANHLSFCVTIDPVEMEFAPEKIGEEELFFMSKAMMKSVDEMAASFGLKQMPPVILEGGEQRFIKGGRLYHIEKNIFRIKIQKASEFTPGDKVEIICADNAKEELIAAASKVKSQVINGKRYSEIAIITPDINRYMPYVREVFSLYDIPVFTDQTENILSHPLISFLNATIEIIQTNFSERSVFSYLRSYMTDIQKENIDLLENYCLATGIRGSSSYKKAFKYKPSGIKKEELYILNEIREGFVSPLNELIDVFDIKDSNPSVREIIRQLVMLMDHYRIWERMCEKHEEDIYELVIGLFDKIDIFLEGETLSAAEFLDAFKAGCLALKRKRLPGGSDMLIFGDLKRTRLENIKTLIIIGANDGVMPGIPDSFGLISERERIDLLELGLSLSPLSHRRVFDENFYIYLALTRASNNLIISYSNYDQEGKETAPSQVVNLLLELFPDISVKKVQSHVDNYTLAKDKMYLDLWEYLSGLEKDKEQQKEFGALLSIISKEENGSLEEIIETMTQVRAEDVLGSEVMRAIDGGIINAPVSRLESYARCAYAFFLNYILKLKKKRERQLSNMDMGSIYHDCIYNFFMLLKESKKEIAELSPKQRTGFIDKALSIAYEKIEKSGDYSSASYAYIKRRVATTIEKTIWALSGQIEKGSFRPEFFEVELSRLSNEDDLLVELKDGAKMRLRGQIDRLDIAESGDGMYIKIIDYKSGNKKIEYSNLYEGMQIQLFYYLDAATRGYIKNHPKKEVVPACIFYYHIDDPLVEVDDIQVGLDENKLRHTLRPNGLINENEEVFKLLDGDIKKALENQSAYSSDAVKLDYTKDMKLSKNSQTIEKEDLDMLMEYCRDKGKELAEKIGEGRIGANPFRDGTKNACSYCDYNPLCSKYNKESLYRDIVKIKDLNEFRELIDNHI